MNQINIGNKSYVTKSFAREFLGYANSNSIDHLIRSRKLSVFELIGTRKKLLCLSELKKNQSANLR